MFIPRFTERGDRILACRGIAPDTKAAVAAILTGDGPAPISVTRCRRTRHAVEDAAHLNAIGEHDKSVRCFVSRIKLENELHRPLPKELPPELRWHLPSPAARLSTDCWPVAVNWYLLPNYFRGAQADMRQPGIGSRFYFDCTVRTAASNFGAAHSAD